MSNSPPPRKMALKRTCILCRKVIMVKVNHDDYIEWTNGMLIQNAFPYLNDDEKEILISSICGTCFNKTIGE